MALLLVDLLVPAATKDATAVDLPAMQTHLDVRYAEVPGVDPNLLSLDLYAPVDAMCAPVAIWVHGGAWQFGDKSRAAGASFLGAFVREGYLVAALNYRLAPAAQFPTYAEDVAAGIAWVHQHVGGFGGDPDRLVLIGHSAGAHLVALVATDASYLQAQGLTLRDLAAVVPVDTEAYDLPRLAARFGGALPPIWGVPFGQDAELWQRASPITHVGPDRGIPPMLVCYSGGLILRRGPNPSRAMDAQAFAAALRRAGVRAEVIGVPKKTHSQIMEQFGLPDDSVAPAVFAFLRSVFADATDPTPR